MSTSINISGIEWEISGSINGITSFSHRNIRVVYDPHFRSFHVKDHTGKILGVSNLRSVAMKNISDKLTKVYALENALSITN